MHRKKANSLQLSGSFLFSKHKPEAISSQYRATQMWHEALELFLSGIPCGVHRPKARFWKVYDSSFTGAGAVTWFQGEIRSHLGRELNREQVTKLLGKYYKLGVFLSVDEFDNNDKSNKGGFRDEKDFKDCPSDIYKLAPEATENKENKPESESESESAKISTPKLKLTPKPIKIALDSDAKASIFFSVVSSALASLSDYPLPSNATIIANIYANIVETPPEFPSWVLSALDYLSKYPEKGDVHVDYPNFENDVFKLVFNYFETYTERHGLLIEDWDLFQGTLAALKYPDTKTPSPKVTPMTHLSRFTEKFPFPKSEVEEIDKIFTPKLPTTVSGVRRFIMGKNRGRKIFNSDEIVDNVISVTPVPMPELNTERYKEPLYFATSFDVCSPITRVVSQSELGLGAYENPSLNLSPADLINHPKYPARLRGAFGRKSLSLGNLDQTELLAEVENSGFCPSSSLSSTTSFSLSLPNVEELKFQALNLLLLTLKPEKRIHLEALLKMMVAVARNQKLELDAGLSNHQVVVNVFYGLIAQQGWETVDLVNFMMKSIEPEHLFHGPFLQGIRDSAQAQIKDKEQPTVSSAKKARKSLSSTPKPKPYCSESSISSSSLFQSYCSQISLTEYEDQRLLGETSKCLRTLLDAICDVKDEKLKKKQLKKFREEYPHIYHAKFPADPKSPFPNKQKRGSRRPFGILF